MVAAFCHMSLCLILKQALFLHGGWRWASARSHNAAAHISCDAGRVIRATDGPPAAADSGMRTRLRAPYGIMLSLRA